MQQEMEPEVLEELELDGLCWLPLPRVHARSLDYGSFLRRFALPRVPCVLIGADEGWRAKERWRSLDYFLRAPLVHSGAPTTLSAHRWPFDPAPEERQVTVGTALQELRDRGERGSSDMAPQPLYLTGWAYDLPGGSPALDADVWPLPGLFGHSPPQLAEAEVLQRPGRRMKWLFIGEAGSATRTHLDVINSSAWLWCARGLKEWRCMHAGDRCLISRSDLTTGCLPDLFAPDLSRWPWLRQARLYCGRQGPGEACGTWSSRSP